MSSVQSVPAFQISPASGGHGLSLSDSAARRLAKLAADEGRPVLLRVAVDGGGYSVSLPFLKGSEIAFVDDLAGAQFVVRNPNAASSCGCGVSFSI